MSQTPQSSAIWDNLGYHGILWASMGHIGPGWVNKAFPRPMEGRETKIPQFSGFQPRIGAVKHLDSPFEFGESVFRKCSEFGDFVAGRHIWPPVNG